MRKENEKCKFCKRIKCICDMESKRPLVCNEVCGNISLHDVNSLKIWRNKTMIDNVIATISVFNNPLSIVPVQVIVNQSGENTVEFIVPSGNTITTSVDNVESIIIQKESGRVEGRFCIDLCFLRNDGC